MKSVCCRAHNHDPVTSYAHTFDHPAVKKLRQDLVSGIRNPICEVCWRDEDLGMISTRQRSIQDKTMDQLQKEVERPQLKWLWIDPGNYCNLACRVCFPKFSVPLGIEWAEKWEDHRQLVVRRPDLSVIADQDLSAIEYVMILGGEPFLNLDHLHIIDRVIDQKNDKKFTIIYVTNNEKSMPDRLVTYLKSFESIKFQIVLSIDAVEDQFEYIRTKGHWSNFCANLQYLRDLQSKHDNLQISVNCTIGLLNCLYLDELYTWLHTHDIEASHITAAFVEGADHYSFRVLDQDRKKRVVDHLSQSRHDLNYVIGAIEQSDFDQELIGQFWKETAWTKHYHGLDVHQYLPRLTQLLLT